MPSFIQAVCNAFWLLNRYFAASEITWMLNEGVFLLRMLAYPFDSESYLWYYYVFGWGKFGQIKASTTLFLSNSSKFSSISSLEIGKPSKSNDRKRLQ